MKLVTEVKIRKATVKDFDELYALGKNAPELKVSSNEDFMEAGEFKSFITDNDCIFLVAEEDRKIIGFVMAHLEWLNMRVKKSKNKYAVLVFIVVAPEFRGQGTATKLYNECIKKLKTRGATHIYCWANADGQEIVEFVKKQGFAEGHKYIWMDKKL